MECVREMHFSQEITPRIPSEYTYVHISNCLVIAGTETSAMFQMQ